MFPNGAGRLAMCGAAVGQRCRGETWQIEGDSPNPICAKAGITIGLEGF